MNRGVAGADDVDAIMAIMGAAFDPAYGEAWSRCQVTDALLLPNCHYNLIDNAQGGPGGFTLSRYLYDEEELLLVAVHPAARRQGLGRQLIDDLTRAARARGAGRLILEMRCGNPAESLYRAMGFVPVGRRPDYYRDGRGGRIDAITFALTIDPL